MSTARRYPGRDRGHTVPAGRATVPAGRVTAPAGRAR
jgi:hypothetical protein